jgi:hypothetical protein
MSPSKQTKKDALLAEVLEAGSGKAKASAMGTPKGSAPERRNVGRPAKEPTIPFTLRLRQGSAELLQRLVADLQARAIRGELSRSEATIGTVVEEALTLYDRKHRSTAGGSSQSPTPLNHPEPR